MFKYDYESRTRPNMTTKKVVSILNEIINSKRYFYLLHKSILNLTEKYQPQTLCKVLHKFSKHSISAREIEDYYNFNQTKKRNQANTISVVSTH